MCLLIIWGLSIAGHTLLIAGFLQLVLTGSCCPWRGAEGWGCCSRAEGDALFAQSWHVLSPWCFCVPVLCTSNAVSSCQGMGKMNVFFKCWPMTWKIWMRFRALLPTYCMTFSELLRARPKLLVLDNTHGQSARKTLQFEGEAAVESAGVMFFQQAVCSVSKMWHILGVESRELGSCLFRHVLSKGFEFHRPLKQGSNEIVSSPYMGEWKVLRFLHITYEDA